jgi:hypothetical protein
VDESEIFLGGFYSPTQLSLGEFAVGAGLYATNRRLFVFRKDMDIAFNKIATGSGRKDFVPASLTPEQNQAIVNQLSAESSSSKFLPLLGVGQSVLPNLFPLWRLRELQR